MAVWATFVWERIARWIDFGAPHDPSPRLYSTVQEGEIEWVSEFVSNMRDAEGVNVSALLSIKDPENLFRLKDPSGLEKGFVFSAPQEMREEK